MRIPVLIAILLLIVACSSTPIDTEVRDANDGFVIGTGDIAVVLTHGLGASPYEVKYLAQYLADRNITVYAVRLQGHGTSVEDLKRTSADDWYKSYHEAILSVKPLKEKVFVAGMSLGGVMALKAAEDEQVDGVIALSPALELADSRSNYAWLYKYFVPYSNRNISQQHMRYYYNKFPVASVAQAVSFSNDVKESLAAIDEPIFIMEYRIDERVNPESSQIIYDSVSSSDKELNWIDGKGHVMILPENDPNAEHYFEQIYQFILKHS
ncbi:MAG TPA: alpha/beta fold hydrolase [Candidatus Nanoarchaeia archaeon]|nr:alpha/beta fold hydrolase [Candidatus Nanoarchaeia archaeon]